MNEHIVFVGAGHAHLTAISKINYYIKKGMKVTVINKQEHHYYSGMAPGILSGYYEPNEFMFNIKKLTQEKGGNFIKDTAEKIDPDNNTIFLKSGIKIKYDVVSFNIGSVSNKNTIKKESINIFSVKPVDNFIYAKKYILDLMKIKDEIRLGIVGGGADGVETAGNAYELIKKNNKKVNITIIAGEKLLKRFPEKVRNIVMNELRKKQINVVEGDHVKIIENNELILQKNRNVKFDIALLSSGIVIPEMFKVSGLPVGEDNALIVNDHLQSVKYENVFGGGDCISLESKMLDKVGVYAIRQNKILYKNLMLFSKGKKLLKFKPQKNYLVILNLGNDEGLFYKKGLIFMSKLAFKIKDRIDRNFMKKFQLSGELKEK